MDLFIKELEMALKGVTQRLQEELQAVRSNRPSVQLVENIPVDVYGQSMTIKQLGSLSIRPPRDVEITVWDKTVIGAIMKAIQDANAGLSAGNDGMVIRASLPVLTDERRQEFSKIAKKIVEQAKIQIRAKRDEINKKVKAAEDEGVLSEDQAFKGKERLQKVVDESNKFAELLLNKKLEELAE